MSSSPLSLCRKVHLTVCKSRLEQQAVRTACIRVKQDVRFYVQDYNEQVKVGKNQIISTAEVSYDGNNTSPLHFLIQTVLENLKAIFKKIKIVLSDTSYAIDTNYSTTNLKNLDHQIAANKYWEQCKEAVEKIYNYLFHLLQEDQLQKVC